jgi:sirohydrochlorin cobaltochelatase
LTSSSAYLLVFHGSRDSRTQLAASHLVRLLTTELKSKTILTQQNHLTQDLSFLSKEIVTTLNRSKIPLVEAASLELASLSLHESIALFAQKARKSGYERIKVLPLFLGSGVHVQEDIPTEIAKAMKMINDQIIIELSPHLGKYSGIVQLLARKFTELSGEGRILVAHGSRLPMVDNPWETLGSKLNAIAAYWSVSPSLAQQVEVQVATGKKKIAILPYFLFPGRITTAIASQVVQLQTIFPQTELILGEPLGATPELAKLIVEEI